MTGLYYVLCKNEWLKTKLQSSVKKEQICVCFVCFVVDGLNNST